MSVFCAEARGTVMHRRTATTGVVVRRALVSRYDSHFHHCAVLRVSSRASREPAGAPIAPWQPPAPQFARSPRRSRRHAVKTHIWIAKCGLPLDRQSTYDMLQIPRVALLEQVPLHQLRTPPPRYSDAFSSTFHPFSSDKRWDTTALHCTSDAPAWGPATPLSCPATPADYAPRAMGIS